MSDCCDVFRFTDPGDGFSVGEGGRGPAGKSAYEAAREGGYQGTEAEFNEALAEIDTALQPSDVDSQLSGSSENPVQNKVIYNALQNIHIDVDDELSDSSENPVQNKVITQELTQQKSLIEDLEALTNRKAGMLVDTASGAIASFTPDSTIDNLLGVSVAVEPVQDLHGYDSPWPAGGKNQLIFKTISGNVESNGKITSTQDFHLLVAKVTAAQTYVYSADGVATPSGAIVLAYFSSEPEIGSVSYDGQRITTGQNPFVAPIDGYVAVRVASSSDVRRQIEAGSTATAYFPYSNLCPISGWSAVGIEAAGVNLLELDNATNPNRGNFTYTTETAEKVRATKTAAGGSFFAQYKLSVKAGETYTFALDSYSVGGVAQQTANIYLYSDRLWGTSVKGNWNVPTGGAQWTATYTGTVVVGIFSTVASNTAIELSGFQCALGTAKPAFKPYAGNQYTIILGETVYGGTLDATAGTMTVDRRFITIDGNSNIGKESTGWAANYEAFYLRISDYPGRDVAVNVTPNIVSNQLKAVSYNNLRSREANAFSVTFTASAIYVEWLSTSATVEEEKARITNAPIQVAYELATPFEIQLDPVSISTISGQTNNVWADAGDVSVEYAADIKAYIDRLNQSPEDDMIANTLIASGKYFTVNNRLFLSTASIAAGAQIIPGHNCTETSLVEALNALNA